MIFFFFKQKTAYEMLRSLVGSEMCIRDSANIARRGIREVLFYHSRHHRGTYVGWLRRAEYHLSLIHI